MTDIDLGPKATAFRAELRDWLAAHVPEDGRVDRTTWVDTLRDYR